ncbi:spore coat protein U-like protein [Idiomarina fontislapidosi]|uniref:Spore coat protein n=1 Tax=Idiomarina fontislapidosi TaxID=263723 RepID=A0A432XUV2_9GAMM|nr:spore coat U domain-containing protein [Idiomarina fontislapidosi]PYE31815.1 spore coat protein U-like protein [Idiomarina fontislapidosi]RUO52510.1 spore coat protein [Idiomarina fontislapidosi]
MFSNKPMYTLLAAVSFCSVGAVNAQQVTGTMSVTLIVEETCVVDNLDTSGGSNDFGVLDFGTVTDLAMAVDATGGGAAGTGIQMTCSDGLAYQIGINNGSNESGSVRNMFNAINSELIGYEVYQDAARTTRWGDVNSGEELSTNGTGTQQNYVVYGRVPSAVAPSTGTYSDTLTVTVLW